MSQKSVDPPAASWTPLVSLEKETGVEDIFWRVWLHHGLNGCWVVVKALWGQIIVKLVLESDGVSSVSLRTRMKLDLTLGKISQRLVPQDPSMTFLVHRLKNKCGIAGR